jgi:TRAP-type uncharacterized transport system substrate-binding protein
MVRLIQPNQRSQTAFQSGVTILWLLLVTAGTFYPYGGALCQVINRAIGTSITATATGGGRENIALLENEEVEFALVDTDMMSYALTGSETFSGKELTHLQQ